MNEGQETFTILSGNTVIGTPVSVNVTAGAASASYILPGGTTTGTYTIQAVYDGTADYGSSMDSSQTLAVTAATTVTAAEGRHGGVRRCVCHALRDDHEPGGHSQSGDRDIHDSQRRDAGRHSPSRSTSPRVARARVTRCRRARRLTRTRFRRSITAQSTSSDRPMRAKYSSSARHRHSPPRQARQPYSATLSSSSTQQSTSPAVVVDQGTETFTILNGTTPVGSPVTVNVSSGAASAAYPLAAGTPPGTYIIQAVFNGTTDFSSDTDHSQTLLISAAGTTTAATSAIATLGQSSVTLNATVAPARPGWSTREPRHFRY